MKPVITLFLVLFSCSCFARQTFTYQFDLNKPITAKLSDKIGYIRVADARVKTDNLGYIREYGAIRTLITDGTFEAAMTAFANKHFIANRGGTDTMLFILRDLSLEQNPINMDVCTIYMQVDIFRGSNDQYKEIYHVDTFCLLTNGNMPRIMFSRFTELLDHCVGRGHNEALYATTSATYSLNDAIHLPEIEKSKFPAYNTRMYKRGIYLTPDEFLTQTPSITNFKVVEYEEFSKTKPGIYRVDSNGKLGERIKNEIYTIYNGDEYKNESATNMNDYMSMVLDITGRRDSKRIRKITSGFDVSSITDGMTSGLIDHFLQDCKLLLRFDYKTHRWMPVRLFF